MERIWMYLLMWAVGESEGKENPQTLFVFYYALYNPQIVWVFFLTVSK